MKTLIAATAAIALLAGTAGATEYDFRVLDPLPEGLVHYLEHDEPNQHLRQHSSARVRRANWAAMPASSMSVAVRLHCAGIPREK